jgi:UDP-GlcNAc:undecaprenyl-phosphate/decaprenyl-phosphate GlcNAc-1-phosphate transferase
VENVIPLAVAVVSIGIPWAVAWFVASRAIVRGKRVPNYRAVDVPLGLGWAWVVVGAYWLLVAVAGIATGSTAALGSLVAALLVLGVALLGWLDDRYGTGEARGLRGHLRALARGRVTTGLVKLVGIGGLSVAAAWFLPARLASTGPWSWVAWACGAIVIAGTTNLVNLLDLRPGRALKAYVLLCLVAALSQLRPPFGGGTPAALGLALVGVVPVLVPALAVWRLDLSERGMLGDMGANAAGATAGYALASTLPLPGLLVAAVLVATLNLASERVSFSSVIQGNRALRWVDALGRKDGAGVGESGSGAGAGT